jgi:hypothetical protein
VSIFDRAEEAASRTVDVVNRTKFVITPQARSTPNGRRSGDPDRPVLEGYCIFDYISKEYGLELGVRKTYRESNDLRAISVGRDAIVSIDRRYFMAFAEEPKQGDIIEFPEKPQLPGFEIMDVQRDGMSRLELRLVHMGSQA